MEKLLGKSLNTTRNIFLDGMKALNLIPPTHIAKATDYISQQISLLRALKQRGCTYQTSDGIYFDTSTFPRYADFAQLDLSAQKAWCSRRC